LKKRIQISIVSYSNTLPFNYGIDKGDIKQSLLIWDDYPSLSAQRVVNSDVDIALVPVGILPKLKQYKIFSDYCIGAVGKVDSVILFSNVPLDKIRKIKLDYQSTTSNKLLQILCAEYWKLDVEFESSSIGYETQIAEDEGGLIIGDRAFVAKGQYTFQYDLAEAWYQYTGLPFVFAVWIHLPNIDKEILTDLNFCFQVGLDNIDSVCKSHHELDFDLADYLNNKISYQLDEAKRKGLDLFMEKIKNLS
jgi:chorismate dehydratase